MQLTVENIIAVVERTGSYMILDAHHRLAWKVIREDERMMWRYAPGAKRKSNGWHTMNVIVSFDTTNGRKRDGHPGPYVSSIERDHGPVAAEIERIALGR